MTGLDASAQSEVKYNQIRHGPFALQSTFVVPTRAFSWDMRQIWEAATERCCENTLRTRGVAGWRACSGEKQCVLAGEI